MLFCKRTWDLKVKTGINILNLTTCEVLIELENRQFLQTCKYWAPFVDGLGSTDTIAAAKRKMKNFQKNIPWVHRQHAKCTFCVSSVDLTRDAKSF